MTKEQAKAMLKARRECIELDTSGNAELCDRNCGECKLNYEKGNMGEQKIALDMAIKALEKQSCDDAVSRQAVLDTITQWLIDRAESRIETFGSLRIKLDNLPSVTPTHGTCKDCKNSYTDEDGLIYCCNMYELARFYPKEDFYCKDFEKLDKVEQIVNKSYTEDEFYNVVQDIKEVLEQE